MLDCGDVSIFNDIENAELYMEPYDLDNGCIEVFNETGFPQKLSIVRKKGRILFFIPYKVDAVHIQQISGIKPETIKLRQALMDFLIRVDDKLDFNELEQKSLKELVDITNKWT